MSAWLLPIIGLERVQSERAERPPEIDDATLVQMRKWDSELVPRSVIARRIGKNRTTVTRYLGRRNGA
jgi:IS30 family transposase